MGFLSGLVGGRRVERREALGKGSTAWILQELGEPSATGLSISPEAGLAYSAVLGCVRVLAEGLASLPCLLYERYQDNGREAKRRASGHKIYPLLHNAPNPVITAFEFYELGMAQILLWGNFYGEIEWDQRGEVMALWPLPAWRMKAGWSRQGKVYELWLDGQPPETFPDYQILHVPGFGYDGVKGKSMISLAREAVGLGLSTQRYGSAFFNSGARPGGVLEHPGQLGDEAHKRLKESWEDRHQGLSGAQRLAILEEGMKYTALSIPPDDAQFLETRKFQRSEIAGIFRVPPHMIGDLERATFSNIEQQSIDFYRNTLQPWLKRWEQRLMRSLLVGNERERYFVEFLADALLRADTQARYQAYAVGRQWGWLSVNDIRQRENLNPVDGGEDYLTPLNMIEAGGPLDAERSGDALPGHGRQGAGEQRSAGKRRQRLDRVWRPVIADAAGRFVRREANDVGNAALRFSKAGAEGEFLLWADEFYRDHQGYTAGQMRPVLFSYGELVAAGVEDELSGGTRGNGEGRADLPAEVEPFAQRYIEAMAQRHATWSQNRIRELLEGAREDGADWYEALKAEFDDWRETRPARVARQESVRFNNALAVGLYVVANVALRWRAFGESCPYCRALNGRVVGNKGFFLGEGEEFQPEGAERPLKVGTMIRHAPAHDGCDCMVLASL